MSPLQTYRCPTHGEFVIRLTFKDPVLKEGPCPDCGETSRHVLKPPAGIRVIRDWNEQANEQQRDPYTQARAQAYNMYHEQRDSGIEVDKPTEEAIQVAAASIASTPRPRGRPKGAKSNA